MSYITDVTKIPSFDKQQYDALIQDAKSRKVDVRLVNASLLNAVNAGQSFAEALRVTTAELPVLATPQGAIMGYLANWPGTPAPGAVIMALITELSADQRQQNRELVWAQTEAVVDSMKEQADRMRDMAVTQLVLGLASAATTMAGGLAQSIMAGKQVEGVSDMLLSTKAQGVGTAIGGGAKGLDAVNQYMGAIFQAEFKEMEADQEKMRAMRDSIKDLNDSLKELIQKSLASAESIQQGKNQATTRILA